MLVTKNLGWLGLGVLSLRFNTDSSRKPSRLIHRRLKIPLPTPSHDLPKSVPLPSLTPGPARRSCISLGSAHWEFSLTQETLRAGLCRQNTVPSTALAAQRVWGERLLERWDKSAQVTEPGKNQQWEVTSKAIWSGPTSTHPPT